MKRLLFSQARSARRRSHFSKAHVSHVTSVSATHTQVLFVVPVFASLANVEGRLTSRQDFYEMLRVISMTSLKKTSLIMPLSVAG